MAFRVFFMAAAFAVTAGLSFHAAEASTIIPVTNVRAAGGFHSGAVDPITGLYYVRTHYSGGNLQGFANATAFESNTASSSITAPGGAPFGGYFAVRDGVVYGRTDTSSTTIGAWDAATGALLNSASVPGYCGLNGMCGFDWGGGSAMNVLQDQTGIYLFGASGSTEWVLSRIETDLSTTVLTTFAMTETNDGYAFMINGTLFLGESYNSEFVTQSYSIADDTLSTVDFQIDSSLANVYRNNTFYDFLKDSLYIFDRNGSRLEKVGGAAALFGVDLAPGAQVPLPATAIPLLMGLLGLGALRRRA